MFATKIAQSVNVSTTRRDVEIDKKEMSKPVEENDRGYEETAFVSARFRPEITFPQLTQLSYHAAPNV